MGSTYTEYHDCIIDVDIRSPVMANFVPEHHKTP